MVIQYELHLKEKVRNILNSYNIYFEEEYKPGPFANIRYDFFFVLNDIKIALETKGDISEISKLRGNSVSKNIREKIAKGYLNFCDYLIVIRPDRLNRHVKKYAWRFNNKKLRWSTTKILMQTIEGLSIYD